MGRGKRAAVLPKMTSTETRALGDAAASRQRQDTQAAPFDGDGRYITAVSAPGSGTVAVSHNLGRAVRGWIVTRIQAGVPQLGEASSDDNTLTITNSGATCTLDLWVF